MASNAKEVETHIWQALAECTDANELRNAVFGRDKLLDQYLQLAPDQVDEIKELLDKVLQRIQDLKFDEFRDEEFANWRRIRSLIEHENILVNHRLGWLLSSQAFLFTAFTLVFNVWKNSASNAGNQPLYLLSIISTVGILICLSIQRGLNAAEEQLRALDKWWYREGDEKSGYRTWKTRKERDSAEKNRIVRHPPIQGFIRYVWWDRWLTYSVVPTVFMIAWALIIVLIVFDLSSPVSSFLSKQGFLFFSYVVVALVALAIREAINRIRSNS